MSVAKENMSLALPRPEGWSAPDLVEDTIVADGVPLRRAGISCVAPDGTELTGSAAEAEESPVARSCFELVERMSTLIAILGTSPEFELLDEEEDATGNVPRETLLPESDEPARWRFARSNGVAIHSTWRAACDHARWELAERDRILRSWYGEIAPQRMDLNPEVPLFGARSYEWMSYEFPAEDCALWSSSISVVGVFGFPRAGLPMVVGYAGRESAELAQVSAAREAAQLLAFLWGEAIPESPPDMGPTPMHHLEQLIHPARARTLRSWLGGDFHCRPRNGAARLKDEPVRYVDLTPSWLVDGSRVVKAIHAAAEPLAFGESPFVRHLPPEQRAHPIP
jgi:hypothetical protein